MIDRVLEVGACFDWLSPLAAILGDLAHGGGYTFLVDIGASPYTGREIEIMLRRRGVSTWGAMIVDGTLMMSVKQSQARYAAHLLESAGVPLENAAPAPSPRQAPRPSPAARRADIMARSRILAHLERRR